MEKPNEQIKKIISRSCTDLLVAASQSNPAARTSSRLFYEGLRSYFTTGITPNESYQAMRHLYFHTNGKLPLYFKAAYNKVFPLPLPLESYRSKELEVANTIASTGYATIDQYFGGKPETLEEVRALLSHSNQSTQNSSAPFKTALSQERAAELQLFKAILSDSFLMNVVSLYLGSPPLIDIVTAWRLNPCSQYTVNDLSESALMYHVDLDRVNFLKLFDYLNDVDDANGPHHYIPGSHFTNMPKILRLGLDRRYTDSEIRGCGLIPTKITGKAGTVIFGDTHCLHKGSVPNGRHRDIFQIEFCLSMFGSPHKAPRLPKTNLLRDTALSE